MLTIEGTLGLYTKGTDFKCSWLRKDNYACRDTVSRGPRWKAFARLQQLTKNIAEQVPQVDAPVNTNLFIVDGAIGFISSTWIQFIANRFGKVVDRPDNLADVFYPYTNISNEEIVERIAAHADEIYTWFEFVSLNYPEAINAQAPPPPEVIYRKPRTRFRAIGALVIGTALLGILGYAATSVYHQSKGA